MGKRTILPGAFALFLLLFAITAGAAPTLQFEKAGGGTYLYCNNDEGIHVKDLADNSVDTPSLIMQNQNLVPGKYTAFLSHINTTGEQDDRYAYVSPGREIALDVHFTAAEFAKIRITALGFSVLEPQDGTDWGFLSAWADYLQAPITVLGSEKTYAPLPFAPVEFTVSAGEDVWLSEFIAEYRPVPFLMPVHIVVDFEVLEGGCGADVAALSVTDDAKDRSGFATAVLPGKYYRDRQYKGIADTLPVVEAALPFVIDAATPLGEPLPVSIVNQYYPEGKETGWFITNINPQADRNVRALAAESDMLAFTYEDGTKSGLYADSVPEEVRSSTWYFDVFHDDVNSYGNPNALLDTLGDHGQIACNLGNYGVTTRFCITAKNTRESDVYFNYHLKTTANILVRVYDEAGTPYTDYYIGHGQTEVMEDKTMASILLPAGSEKTFIIEFIMTTNYMGGTQHAFFLSAQSEAPAVTVPQKTYREARTYAAPQLPAVILENTDREELLQNRHSYTCTEKDGKLLVRWSAYDGYGSQFHRNQAVWRAAYLFDADGTELQKIDLGAPVTAMDYLLGTYYATVGSTIYYSDDGADWQPFLGSMPLMEGRFALWNEGSGYLVSPDGGGHFYRLAYQQTAPANIKYFNNRFYLYDAQNRYLGFSKDGIYPTPQSEIVVSLRDEVLVFDTPPVIENGRTLVPLRFLAEKLGAAVQWEQATQTVTLTWEGHWVQLQIGSDTAFKDGEVAALDAPACNRDSRTFVPLRFVAETFGLTVEWDEASRWVFIS